MSVSLKRTGLLWEIAGCV